MRPIAIFRFSPAEGPGYFADWLDARALPWRLFALDDGAAVPGDPRAFAGIGMMGGPMSVNDGFAWTAPLGAMLRDAVGAGVPVIGHCLGGQLLAQALGAPVTRTDTPEIGWLEVAVCDDAAQRAWFGGRAAFTTFEWHYDVFGLPVGATRVLTNGFNGNQAYVVDDRHIGFQGHIEMTRDLTETWLATGANELPARSTPAAQCAADIRCDIDARVASLHAVAGDVYAQWSRGLAR
jgi:GMP synthase-like glutamine amidotransferase